MGRRGVEGAEETLRRVLRRESSSYRQEHPGGAKPVDRASGRRDRQLSVQAFQTPLATLHAFQGWADKFLATPSGGIEDLYVSVAGKFRGTGYSVVYHRFDPETGGPSYGSEWDLVVKRPFAERYSIELKYANYNASSHATDTQKLWVMFAAKFGN